MPGWRIRHNPTQYSGWCWMNNDWQWQVFVWSLTHIHAHICFVLKDCGYAGAKFDNFPGGGLGCVFVDTVHSLRLCLEDGTIVSFFVSSLTDDIFVLKYSAYIQTSRSSPPLQWPPVLVGNPKENICVNTSIGSQSYVKPAARSNSSRLSLSAILCWWISRRW